MVLERTSERLIRIGFDVKFIITIYAWCGLCPWVVPSSDFGTRGTCLCAISLFGVYTVPRGPSRGQLY